MAYLKAVNGVVARVGPEYIQPGEIFQEGDPDTIVALTRKDGGACILLSKSEAEKELAELEERKKAEEQARIEKAVTVAKAAQDRAQAELEKAKVIAEEAERVLAERSAELKAKEKESKSGSGKK